MKKRIIRSKKKWPKNKFRLHDIYYVQNINWGWFLRRHGILLENLPKAKQNLILKSNHMKWLGGEPQVFEVIFKIEDLLNKNKNRNRLLWNDWIEDFTTLSEIEKYSNTVKWNCAICKTNILSSMEESKIENFVCEKCSEYHNSKNKVVDDRIIKSSIKFLKHCERLYENEQKEFFNHLKKNKKD